MIITQTDCGILTCKHMKACHGSFVRKHQVKTFTPIVSIGVQKYEKDGYAQWTIVCNSFEEYPKEDDSK